MSNQTTYILNLPNAEFSVILSKVTQALMKQGFEGLELVNEIDNATNGRLCDIQDLLLTLEDSAPESYTNETTLHEARLIFVMHDTVYLSKTEAQQNYDGKDSIIQYWTIVRPCEILMLGGVAQDWNLYATFADVQEDLNAFNNEDEDNELPTCDTCKHETSDGFIDEDTGTVYCSTECLYVDGYTEEQYNLDYQVGGIYYTTFGE